MIIIVIMIIMMMTKIMMIMMMAMTMMMIMMMMTMMMTMMMMIRMMMVGLWLEAGGAKVPRDSLYIPLLSSPFQVLLMQMTSQDTPQHSRSADWDWPQISPFLCQVNIRRQMAFDIFYHNFYFESKHLHDQNCNLHSEHIVDTFVLNSGGGNSLNPLFTSTHAIDYHRVHHQ